MSNRAFASVSLALALAFAAPAVQAQVFDSQYGEFRVSTVVDGLNEPWGMTWLPGGDMLVTERSGDLRIVRNGQLDPEPISGVPEVFFRGQGGLLDVEIHPDFATNQLVYISYSKPHEDGRQNTTAVARGRLEGNALVDVEDIFVANAWATRTGHFGSRLLFDGQGHLFVTVGDRMASPDMLADHPAQDISNHNGTVNRIYDDGGIPADNPFVGTAGAEGSIWSYGHRNLQGLAMHPTTGDVWQTEHGPQGGDELNLVMPGRNYGWPVIGYGVNYGGAPLHPTREMEGMEQPKQFFTPSIATSGLMIYGGSAFPDWQGNAFLGGLAHELVARIPLTGDDLTQVGRPESPSLLQGFGPVRDIAQGPDDLIYIALREQRDDGMSRIIRLEPMETN